MLPYCPSADHHPIPGTYSYIAPLWESLHNEYITRGNKTTHQEHLYYHCSVHCDKLSVWASLRSGLLCPALLIIVILDDPQRREARSPLPLQLLTLPYHLTGTLRLANALEQSNGTRGNGFYNFYFNCTCTTREKT